MVDVSEALKIILQQVRLIRTQTVALNEAAGSVLREGIRADRDFPPYDRVSMDGIAINFHCWQSGQTYFPVEGQQLAGEPQKKLVDPSNCLEVMTGAILPEGADTVVRYEDMEIKPEEEKAVACIKTAKIARGQNVHPAGKDRKRGELLIKPGVRISPAEIAVAASVGKSVLTVSANPRIAVISTGDELVPIGEQPLAHQIRQSNAHMIRAALSLINIPSQIFHLPDNMQEIESRLSHIFSNYEIVALSGGVSKGKADFIPEAMEALGVQRLFHSVAQRPGKPFWFGTGPQAQAVFAFPGNPVSTFAGYCRYFRPYLNWKQGIEEPEKKAVLAKDFTFKPDLTLFLQVKTWVGQDGQLMAYPVPGKGSGDFANLLECDGFLELPRGRQKFKAWEVFDFLPFRTPDR